jgi:putative phage-type endonuclease
VSVQGSPEWLAERLGKVTASKMDAVMARTKNGWGADRANYMAQLIAERLTGKPQESFSSAAMAWGVETEPQARDAYAFYSGLEVSETGFHPHPTIQLSGASPDGLVGADGLLEIKCPNTATHIDTLLGGAPKGKYVLQMQWQMACTGRKWCDFVSFDPRMPEDMRYFCARVKRGDEVIKELEENVLKFLAELTEKLAALDKIHLKEAA